MKGLLLHLFLLREVQAAVVDLFPRAASCTEYTIKTGDTCFTIGRSQDVTHAQIVAWNSGIDTACSNLGSYVDTQICVSNPLGDFAMSSNSIGATTVMTTVAAVPTPIPDNTNSKCGEYCQVAAGDDCATLTTYSGITLPLLESSGLENCTNLWLDYYYCVQLVGQISTYAGYGGSSTRPPFVKTPTTEVPYVDLLAGYPSSDAVIPLANKTRVDCYSYIWFPEFTNEEAADCWLLAMTFGVERESQDFVLWNPSIARDSQLLNELCGCADDAETTAADTAQVATSSVATETTSIDFDYSCTLATSSSYCVLLSEPTETSDSEDRDAPPSPRAAGEIENCTRWYAPEDYDTCDGMLLTWGFTFDEFYTMNPSISEDCSKMSLGTYYCLSTYVDGIPAGISGAVTSVTATSTTAAATTKDGVSSTSTTATGVTTPGPIQTGMTESCTTFYKVVSGDGCYDLAQAQGIALADFYSWSPAVNSDCSGLQANVYVCVGV
ncbi:hypothetical protein EDB80DRAFT_891746 [Ilyonectria destructans]|nr:hypothetical protein EDB80DRAFT_891746 [Ilyonectria destructans]